MNIPSTAALEAFLLRALSVAGVAFVTYIGSNATSVTDPQTAAFVAAIATVILNMLHAHATGDAHADPAPTPSPPTTPAGQ